MIHLLVAFALVLPSLQNAHAEEVSSTSAVDEVSLEDLLSMKTSVATKRATSARSAPGIVSIITDSEIRAMGAKDLLEVLRTVPSLNFGTDVQGVVGLGIRGMWAHEGKFLFIIDGIEMNEIQYGTTQFGGRYPVDQIKRIEIIRGPGSVIYGGFAELAVINVITKSGSDINGANVQYTYGQMAKGSEHNSTSLSVGKAAGDYEYSFTTSSGYSRRGEGIYTGTNGATSQSFSLEDGDELKPRYVNAGLLTEKMKLRFIYDEYKTTSRTWYNYSSINQPIQNNFRSVNFAANYTFNVLEGVTITPYAHYYIQTPWNQASEEAHAEASITMWSDVHSYRFKTGFTASKDLTSKFNILAGYEYLRDQNSIVRQMKAGVDVPFNNGGQQLDLYSHALLAQAQWQLDLFNLTLGARYEDPSRTDGSFVPRVGLTREEKNWHAKFLWSNAFRSPVLYNLNVRPDIKPEKTQTFEFETGVATGSSSYLTANLYHTKVKNPIVYYFTTADQYDNFHSVATKGIELDWRRRNNWGEARFGYAYYEVDNNHVPKYQFNSSDDALLGMPQHQAVVGASINLPRELKLGPTLIYYSSKYTFDADTSTNLMREREMPSVLLANLYLSKENLFVKGMSGGVGVNNILNSDNRYVQPYGPDAGASSHSPLPGPSRDVFARLEYQASF